MKDTSRDRLIAYAIFTGWLLVVTCATWNHAVWRDEVRALSKALEGDTVFAMLSSLRAEGHPAVWYLLVRGAYTLVGKPYVLQIVALLVAASSTLLLLSYAPFSWWLKALLLAGNTFLFEYSVMARNYGISMLLLFVLAIAYPRNRDRGILLGVLLFLLANCNAHSILLVGGFLLLWFTDIVAGDRKVWPRAFRILALNAAIAILGAAVCVFTIVNATQNFTEKAGKPVSALVPLLGAVVAPGSNFEQLSLTAQFPVAPGVDPVSPLIKVLLSIVLFGSTLGLIRTPGLFLAAAATLSGFSVFFRFIYMGGYRHEALWLSFLIACYWMAATRPKAPRVPIEAIGWGFFVLLMASQVPIGVASILGSTGGRPPFSRSRDFGNFIHSRPDLQDAILIADPDYLLESLPFYVFKPTYMMREQRFARIVAWAAKGRARLTLDDVLTDARRLHETAKKPVLILLAHPLDPSAPPLVKHEGYSWEFVTKPEQVSTFLGETMLIKSFPTAIMDEWFDVYLLK